MFWYEGNEKAQKRSRNHRGKNGIWLKKKEITGTEMEFSLTDRKKHTGLVRRISGTSYLSLGQIK